MIYDSTEYLQPSNNRPLNSSASREHVSEKTIPLERSPESEEIPNSISDLLQGFSYYGSEQTTLDPCTVVIMSTNGQDVVLEVPSPREKTILMKWKEILPLRKNSQSELKILLVRINEQTVHALVDDQASLNFMTYTFVEGAGLLGTLRPFKEEIEIGLSDATTCKTFYRVKVGYKVSNGTRSGVQDFYVLPRAIKPLVLGIPFLIETGHSMASVTLPSGIPTSIRNCTWTTHAYLAKETGPRAKANAMPSRGVGSNMMSKGHADEKGYQIDEGKLAFELGNRRKIFAVGEVRKTKIGFLDTNQLPGPPSDFAVVPNLSTDIILGNAISAKNQSSLNLTRTPQLVAGLYATQRFSDKFSVGSEAVSEDQAMAGLRKWLGNFNPHLNGEATPLKHTPLKHSSEVVAQKQQARHPAADISETQGGPGPDLPGNPQPLDEGIEEPRRSRSVLQDLRVRMSGALGQPPVSTRAQKIREDEADIEKKDEHGRTALHRAVCQTEYGIVENLLKIRADVNAEDPKGNTALHLSALAGRSPAITRLLLKNNAEIKAANREGNTALHLAALMGHPRVVSVLLEYKADVKAENLSGETAMGLAASNQRTDVVDLLEGYSS